MLSDKDTSPVGMNSENSEYTGPVVSEVAAPAAVETIRTVLPGITPADITRLAEVCRASQDNESEMNRLLTKYCCGQRSLT